MIWTPIFIHGGNLLCFASLGFASTDEAAAQAIGHYVQHSVKSLTGAEFTGKALEVQRGQRYVKATLAGLPVAILSGPAFTKIAAERTG